MGKAATRRLIVRGRVQGVWYRDWTVEQARELGLAGWVRNRRDGSVEILAAGPPDRIETLLARCWQGPPRAEVSDVVMDEAEEQAPEGPFGRAPTC